MNQKCSRQIAAQLLNRTGRFYKNRELLLYAFAFERAQLSAREPEMYTYMELRPVPARVVTKRAAAPAKVYPPHEHFGSPLNVCRVCGEKYTYTQRPYALDGLSNSEK